MSNATVARLQPNEIPDFKKLLEVFRTVFEQDHSLPPEAYLKELLANPVLEIFVVRVAQEVVGGLTLYRLPGYISTQPTAYIYDVGIHPFHQGKGLGKQLIREVCQYCLENGFDTAYVEAEMADAGAVEFYRRTQVTTELPAIHFTYAFNTSSEKGNTDPYENFI